MDLSEYLPANNLFLLVAGFVIAAIALFWFLRKPQNRHPMDGPRGRMLDERRARQNSQGTTDVPPTRR